MKPSLFITAPLNSGLLETHFVPKHSHPSPSVLEDKITVRDQLEVKSKMMSHAPIEGQTSFHAGQCLWQRPCLKVGHKKIFVLKDTGRSSSAIISKSPASVRCWGFKVITVRHLVQAVTAKVT